MLPIEALKSIRFNTQPREGGCMTTMAQWICWIVSTHSRAKAAAPRSLRNIICIVRFNTQPREGGCFVTIFTNHIIS